MLFCQVAEITFSRFEGWGSFHCFVFFAQDTKPKEVALCSSQCVTGHQCGCLGKHGQKLSLVFGLQFGLIFYCLSAKVQYQL